MPVRLQYSRKWPFAEGRTGRNRKAEDDSEHEEEQASIGQNNLDQMRTFGEQEPWSKNVCRQCMLLYKETVVRGCGNVYVKSAAEF